MSASLSRTLPKIRNVTARFSTEGNLAKRSVDRLRQWFREQGLVLA